MRITISLLLLSMLYSYPVNAEVSSWRSLWEFRLQDLFFDICSHPDGGAYLVGTSANYDYEEASEIRIVALDTDGTVNDNWGANDYLYKFGANNINIAYGATATDNGHCLVVGTTGLSGGAYLQNRNGFFLRVNRWKHCMDTYVIQGHGNALYDIIQSEDGGFIAVGAKQDLNSDIHATNILVSKVDENLDFEWLTNSQNHNPNNHSREFGMDVLELPDNRIVVAGSNIIEGGRLLLLNQNGDIVNSYYNTDLESYTDIELIQNSSLLASQGMDDSEDAHIIALASYGGSSTSYPWIGPYSKTAVITEYVIPANNDFFAVVGTPHIIHASQGIKNFRLHNIHVLGQMYVLTGYAQLHNGSSAVILGTVHNSFQRDVNWTIFEAEGMDANINSYATWMSMGSLIFRRGLFYDCMIAGARHRFSGFGGENHEWNGEAIFQPEVAVAGIGSLLDEQLQSSEGIVSSTLSYAGNPRAGYELQISGTCGQVDIDVFDMAGRMVGSTSFSIEDSFNSFTFGKGEGLGSGLSNGLYFLQIQTNDRTSVQSLVLTR